MLSSFDKLGYSIEWRIINAADYGGAQKKKKSFFYLYIKMNQNLGRKWI